MRIIQVVHHTYSGNVIFFKQLFNQCEKDFHIPHMLTNGIFIFNATIHAYFYYLNHAASRNGLVTVML